VGIALADVSKIREIRADVDLNSSTIKVRAICIPDRVRADDCDGHASMGYQATSALSVSPAQLGKLRKKIRYDLADVFSNVLQPDSYRWPSAWDIMAGRVRSILRELLELARTAFGRSRPKS
jgi:hypothetical protein